MMHRQIRTVAPQSLGVAAATLMLAAPVAAQQQQQQQQQQQGGQTISFIQKQADDQMRMDEVLDNGVFNQGGEDLGDVEDVLFTQDGSAEAIIIGVGGFLGIGEKSVAVPFQSVQVRRAEAVGAPLQLTLNASREALERAPDFRSLQEVQAQEEAVAAQQQMQQQQSQGRVAEAMRAVQEAEAALADQDQKVAQQALQEARRLLEIAAQPVAPAPVEPAAGPEQGQPPADGGQQTQDGQEQQQQ